MQLSEVKKKALVRIVDDDPGLSGALQFFLELEGWRVQVYSRADDFLVSDMPSVPGCAVLDVCMPRLTGLECQKKLREHGTFLPVIFISGHGDIDMAVQTILDGAYDFIQKPVDEERLLRAIEKASSESVRRAEGVVDAASALKRFEGLTEREAEVAKLVAAGIVTRVIAERLGISLRTAELHRAHALKKLEAASPEGVKKILKAAGVVG